MQWKVSQVGVAGKQRHTVGDWVAVLAVSCLSRESKIFLKKWQRLDNREFFVQTIRSNGNKSAMFLCPLKSFVMLVGYPGLWVADSLHMNMQSLLSTLLPSIPTCTCPLTVLQWVAIASLLGDWLDSKALVWVSLSLPFSVNFTL